LTADRQFLAVTHAAPGTDILQALHIHGDFADEFTFGEFFFDTGAEACFLFFVNSLSLQIEIDLQFFEDALGHWATNAFDSSQRDFNALACGENDTRDTDHRKVEKMRMQNELTLALLVLRVLATDTNNTLALAIAAQEGEAVFAHTFDGGANFHVFRE